MLKLTEKRFADYFRAQPETGMGYWVATAYLTDGRIIPQIVVTGDKIAKVRNYESIPFSEGDIRRFEVTYEKWNWRSGA